MFEDRCGGNTDRGRYGIVLKVGELCVVCGLVSMIASKQSAQLLMVGWDDILKFQRYLFIDRHMAITISRNGHGGYNLPKLVEYRTAKKKKKST